jgi:hypothetical protein
MGYALLVLAFAILVAAAFGVTGYGLRRGVKAATATELEPDPEADAAVHDAPLGPTTRVGPDPIAADIAFPPP